MLKNDKWIREQAVNGMITPFVSELVREVRAGGSCNSKAADLIKAGFAMVDELKDIDVEQYLAPHARKVISYGASSYGYDLRLSPNDFRVFRHIPGTIVNPKRFNPDNLEAAPLHSDEDGGYFVIPANSYALGVALERLQVPPSITIVCIGKSTYARCGIIVNVTPVEASWEGFLTLEFSNSSSADCRIYANEGVLQLLFLEGEPCETTYADRAGKYQDQRCEVTLARV